LPLLASYDGSINVARSKRGPVAVEMDWLQIVASVISGSGSDIPASQSRIQSLGGGFMRRTTTILFCWLLSTTYSSFCESMTREEAAVRRAYAKVTLAVQLRTLVQTTEPRIRKSNPIADVASIDSIMAAKKLSFALSDFKSGDISDLKGLKYGDLVTKPSGGDALSISPVRHTFTEGDRSVFTDMADARWIEDQRVLEDSWNVPVSEVVAYAENDTQSHLTRYACYSVTATFEGRLRSYRAMFLFGTDASGATYIHPIDTVMNINGGALGYFITHPIRPDIFMVSGTQNWSDARNWLENNSAPECPDAEDACCNLESIECTTNSGVH